MSNENAVKNIYSEGELQDSATTKDFLVVRDEHRASSEELERDLTAMDLKEK